MFFPEQYLHKIKIYQIKNIEQVNYAFRDFNNKQFNINDYEVVIDESYDTHKSDKEICETYFEIGNNGQLQKQNPDKKIRSISVSDIIEIDGTKYYVQSFGYKEIK